MRTVVQYETKDEVPRISGWYDTDKGRLYWFGIAGEWSCRNDYITNEKPKYWYR